MPLPIRPPLPPYEGETKFGLILPDERRDEASAFKDVLIENLVPVPRPPQEPQVPLPSTCDWISPVYDWEVLGNDFCGDCVPACMAHAIESITDAAGTRVDITLQQTIRAYSDLTGYNSATGQPDPGVEMARGMSYWASTGIGGYRIEASTATNAIGHSFFYPSMIKQSVFYYGAAILSFAMPPSAEPAFKQNRPWVAGMSGFVGYHCVPALAYDDNWCDVITWGRPQRVSWGFVTEHLADIWAVFAPQWLRANGTAPCGLPGDRLRNALPRMLKIMAR